MIIFYCNASPHIGFGHLMRCKQLAYEFKKQGHECMMVGPSEKYQNEDDKKIFTDWLYREKWKSSKREAKSLLNSIIDHTSKFLVLDDYRIDELFQFQILKNKIEWLQFDHSAERPLWGNWILNASPCANKKQYQSIVKTKSANLLLGPKYIILRSEFSGLSGNESKSTVNRVLITFGGGDDRGAIRFILQALLSKCDQKIKFIIVSGEYNPRNQENIDWIRKNGCEQVRYLINPPQLSNLFSSCDIAIISGGTTSFEIVSCGVPMIIITIAENQVEQAKAWDSLNLGIYLGAFDKLKKEKLSENFFQLISQSSKNLLNKFASGSDIVDGKGAERVVNKILNSNPYGN
tara:strand:+ start:1434 stop:2477 length:1044 start_codon:yes stop_codon:yes gene_type:complete